MGWEDRSYYRDRPQGSVGAGILGFLNSSLPLGRWFGINVRMHSSLIIFMALELLFAETKEGIGARSALTSMIILFFSVLLHEFGHCFGARAVGGHADEILMWPLGGLATTDPPRRPWPSFITTAAGPSVNLVICLITGTFLFFESRSATAIPWFPFGPGGIKSYEPTTWTGFYVFWIFTVNYALLMFNLCLLFYPFDGGRMVQELLWLKIGYYKSMMFATRIGMIGAVVAAMVGLVTSFMLVFIAIFGFITCYRQYQMLREMGPESDGDGIDYSAAYEQPVRVRRISPRVQKKLARLAEQERNEQEEIDTILAKVSAQGMHSLTWGEKRALKRATENQRKRDQERAAARRR